MCLWVSYKEKYEKYNIFFLSKVTKEKSRIRS
jgi:hypothetical protein